MKRNSSTLFNTLIGIAVFGGFAGALWTPNVEAKSAKPGATKDSPSCQSCVSQAASLFARGQNAEAAAVLRASSGNCPNSGSLHNLLSVIALRAGNLEEAQAEAALAVGALPNSIAAHFQYAMTLMSAQKNVQCAAEFRKVTELDPANYEAWSALGNLYAQLHQDSDAATAANRAANLEPATRASRLRTVTNLKRAGKYTEATEEIKRLLASSDLTPELAQDLAKEALLVGAFQEAQAACDTVLGAYPNATAPRVMAALAAYCGNDHQACVKNADLLLSRDSHNGDALALKSLALVKLKDISAAEKNAASMSETSSIGLLSRGAIESAKADYAAAEETFQACLEQDASNNAMQGLPHALAQLELTNLYKETNRPVLSNEHWQAVLKDKRLHP